MNEYNENELISLLLSVDDLEFIHIISFLENIILNIYSEELMKEIKTTVYERYNKLSNINNHGIKTRDFKEGD